MDPSRQHRGGSYGNRGQGNQGNGSREHGSYRDNRGGDNRGGGHYRGRGHPYSRDNNRNQRQHAPPPPEVIHNVKKLFNKSFVIPSNDWSLPPSQSWWKSDHFQVSRLQELKKTLNQTKDSLNDKDKNIWHKHTRFTNPAGHIMSNVRKELQAELLTQAWAKFYEMASKVVPDVPKFASVHICEAPGGFIAALNHYLVCNHSAVDWEWFGMTLNPYFEGNSSKEMVDDDLFISKTYSNWYFGLDNTGNVMNCDNIESLGDRVKDKKEDKPVLLVTADGSIDCQDNPNEQEGMVSHLHYCEAVSAISLLDKGGAFLLKGFTLFESSTLCLTYLLSCLFSKVEIVKPLTSKSGNSETYTLCTGFKGCSEEELTCLKQRHTLEEPTASLFARSDIPEAFTNSFYQAAYTFMHHQNNMIQSNIDTFNDMGQEKKKEIMQTKDYAVKYYINNVCKNLVTIPRTKRLVQDMDLNGTQLNTTALLSSGGKVGSNRRQVCTSFTDKLRLQNMSWLEREVIREEKQEAAPDMSFGQRMMAAMGHKDGEGLGKEGAGMTAPIEVQQLGKGQGLGFAAKAKSQAVVTEREAVVWLGLDSNQVKAKVDMSLFSKIRGVFGRDTQYITNSRFVSGPTLERLVEAQKESRVLNNDRLCARAGSVHVYYALEDGYPGYKTSDIQISSINMLTNIYNPGNCAIDISHNAEFTEFTKDQFMLTDVYNTDDNSSLTSLFSINDFSNKLTDISVDNIIFDSSSKHNLLAGIMLSCKHLVTGGSAVIRFNALHCRFNVGIVFLLHCMFGEVSIIKTIACCPHTPELFLVCKDYHGDKKSFLYDYISNVVEQAENTADLTLVECVAVDLLFQNRFYTFVSEINERIAQEAVDMIISLERMIHNNKFEEGRKEGLVEQALKDLNLL